jgi:hypothetical protein
MTTLQITKIKNGRVALPRTTWKSWNNADVSIRVSDDSVLLKRVAPRATIFSRETTEKLRDLGRLITTQDIRAALRVARKSA